MNPFHTTLSNRQVIAISGPDAKTFLQGLISNDIEKATATNSIYSAFLSAQGKFLHDLFISEQNGQYLIDCEKDRAADLIKRLSMYKLRAKVEIKNLAEEYNIAATSQGEKSWPQKIGETADFKGGLVYRDPRLADIGWRMIVPKGANTIPSNFEAYDYARAKLGLPDGSRDMEIDRAIILENGFNELHGIDWEKGCYVGQELTARTKYRGLVRKRLLPCEVTAGGNIPAPATPVQLHLSDGTIIEAGETKSAVRGKDGKPSLVLALLRLEHLQKPGEFHAGAIVIRPYVPRWVELPEEKSEEL